MKPRKFLIPIIASLIFLTSCINEISSEITELTAEPQCISENAAETVYSPMSDTENTQKSPETAQTAYGLDGDPVRLEDGKFAE